MFARMSGVMSPRLALSVACVASLLAACGANSDAADSGTPFEESPLPTIGLGTDLGSISGGTDIRQIDTGSIDSIVMIGDSITVGSRDLLAERFDFLGLENVSITAQTGKRMAVSFGDNASGANISEFVAAGQEEAGTVDDALWIVALGTNDIGQYSDQDEVESAIDAVLAPIPPDAPLIWINTYFADRPEQTDEVNAAIEARLRERGNATIGRWNELAPQEGVLRSDGVHPGQEGAIVFADLVVTTMIDFLQ